MYKQSSVCITSKTVYRNIENKRRHKSYCSGSLPVNKNRFLRLTEAA